MDEWAMLRHGVTPAEVALRRNADALRLALEADPDGENAPALRAALESIEAAIADIEARHLR